jgi:hypothetical protein
MSTKHRKPIRSWETPPEERDPPPICPTTGKRMYPSEAQAKATAAHQMSQQAARVQLRVYRCLYCDSWHLTSKET